VLKNTRSYVSSWRRPGSRPLAAPCDVDSSLLRPLAMPFRVCRIVISFVCLDSVCANAPPYACPYVSCARHVLVPLVAIVLRVLCPIPCGGSLLGRRRYAAMLLPSGAPRDRHVHFSPRRPRRARRAVSRSRSICLPASSVSPVLPLLLRARDLVSRVAIVMTDALNICDGICNLKKRLITQRRAA